MLQLFGNSGIINFQRFKANKMFMNKPKSVNSPTYPANNFFFKFEVLLRIIIKKPIRKRVNKVITTSHKRRICNQIEDWNYSV